MIDWPFERMKQWSDSLAIIRSNWEVSYGEFLNLVELWQKCFVEQGIVAGQVVAVRGDYTPQACSLLLALIRHGAIIVPITKESVHEKEFMDIAQVETMISFDDSDGWNFATFPVVVSNPLILKLRDKGDPGLVFFSSGSTGKNKAILHNASSLLDKFKISRKRFVTLTFLLFDHMGGFNTLLVTLLSGGTVVSTDVRSPDAVCEIIARHHVEVLPTSPTFLNMLLISEAYKRYDLSSLKIVTYGTEIMPESTLRRVAEIFPGVRIQQTYGLSELGVLHSKSHDSKSLWVKVGGDGFETKVVDGVLWVRAHSAMLGYLNAPSPFDSEGWMCTEDRVETKGDFVRFLGRESDIINVGGQKVYPAEVEDVLVQMPNVVDAVVSGEINSLLTIVAAKVRLSHPETLGEFKKRMRVFCKERLASYKIPVRVEITDEDFFSSRYKKIRK